MNENKLKELYNSEIESSSPDMDALWSRIEEKLPEKQLTESNPVRKLFITLTKALAGVAACAVIAIAIPAVMDTKKSESNTASMDINYSDAACADEEYIEENGAFAEEDKAAAAADNADITDAPAEEAVSAESEEMAYFVEEDILVQTECFVDGVVSNVYAESGCVYYELEAKEYEATAGGGAVKVTVTGKMELTKVELSPEVVDPEDVEMLSDLVIAAANEALRAAQKEKEDKLESISGGHNIPGMF